MPPLQNGSKRPAADIPNGVDEKTGKPKYTWKAYQTTPATREHVLEWYRRKRTGVGLFGGVKNLDVFEFDDGATCQEFKRAAAELGLAELVERIESGYLEQSPSGGVHWLFYCDPVRGNTKLACRPAPTPDDPHKVKTLIETRGQGGYIIIAPSHGKVHETGKPYVLLRGGLDTIRSIGPLERDSLDNLARSFDEIPEPAADRSAQQPSQSFKATAGGLDNGGRKPGDDFAERTHWRDILEHHGWVEVTTSGSVT